MAALYDRLDKNQKDVYDRIVSFGKGKDFSTEDINIALQIAYVESEFGKLKDKEGEGAPKGLFQYTERHWRDRQRPGWSKVGKEVKDILVSWGYTKDPKRPEGNDDPEYEKGTVNIFQEKQDDQIAMFYAELKIYADRFKKGVPDPAFNKVCRNIQCPTDPYSRKALYIEATHHSADNIGEVLNGWKNKVQPNLFDNLKYLKSNGAKWNKKASVDDPEASDARVADATERDSDRTTATRQSDAAYQKELAGRGTEADKARRGDDPDRRSIPDSWIADAGNVHSDASNDVRRSAFRAANERMNVEKDLNTMKLADVSTGFLEDPGSPLQQAMAAAGLASDNIRLTPAEGGGNSTSGSFDIRDKRTSEIIGSYVETDTGCEMTAGDKKVVMYQLSDSDVSIEKYARNDEGDFEFLGVSRIGDNDGITLRRPLVA